MLDCTLGGKGGPTEMTVYTANLRFQDFGAAAGGKHASIWHLHSFGAVHSGPGNILLLAKSWRNRWICIKSKMHNKQHLNFAQIPQ